jgi:hypothetical protein
MKKSLLVASVAALSLSASLAHADEAFGTEGRLSVSTVIPVLTWESVKPASGDSQSATVVGPNMNTMGLAVNYWVTKDISLGGALQFSSGVQGKDSSGMTIAPSIGYRYPMGDATLWPKVQPYLDSSTTKQTNGANTTEIKASKFGIGIEVPYLWTRGAFFHGPVAAVRLDLSSSAEAGGTSVDGPKTTSIGIGYQLGGTF